MIKYKSYTIKKIPVTELPSSDTLSILEHHFVGKKKGKKFYFQANLHGPEVVGIGVLLKLIEIIKKDGLEKGEVKIIVSSNPIGLNSKISSYQIGYKNLNSTKYSNWNKIFKQKLLKNISPYGTSVDDKLAYILQGLSKGFDTVIDFHSAQNNIEAIYTFPNSLDLSKTLGVQNIILLNKVFTGCFDEAIYFTSNKKSQVLTLELHGGTFNEEYLNKWATIIYKLIAGKNKINNKVSIWKYNFDLKYHSPVSGLLLPSMNLGETFKKGDLLIEILGINGKKTSIKALSSGVIYKLPLTQFVGEGEEVLEVFQKGKI